MLVLVLALVLALVLVLVSALLVPLPLLLLLLLFKVYHFRIPLATRPAWALASVVRASSHRAGLPVLSLKLGIRLLPRPEEIGIDYRRHQPQGGLSRVQAKEKIPLFLLIIISCKEKRGSI